MNAPIITGRRLILGDATDVLELARESCQVVTVVVGEQTPAVLDEAREQLAERRRVEQATAAMLLREPHAVAS